MCEGQKICRSFLDDLDVFLADNLDELACSDIYDIYSDFYSYLKVFKSNSSGFTGLSEFLIFRIIYHLLGGSFNKVQISKDLIAFESDDGTYHIGQSIPIVFDSKKYYPDIVIYKNNHPFLVAEIKLYLTNGIQTLMSDIDKLTEINKHYPNVKGLFISYNLIPETGKIYKKLMEEKKSKDWLKHLILAGNNQSIKEFLQEILD